MDNNSTPTVTHNPPLMSTMSFQSYGQQPMMLNQQQRPQQVQQQHAMPPAIPPHMANHSSNPPRLTPEKRATHNAIERARRESLNDRFHKLAMSIPTLRQIRKPSKSLIVQKSLEHIVELHRRSESMESAVVRLQRRVAELEEEARLARDGVIGTLVSGSVPNRPQPPISVTGAPVMQDGIPQMQQMMLPQQIIQPGASQLQQNYLQPNMQPMQGMPMTTMSIAPLSFAFNPNDSQRFPNGLALNTTSSPPFPSGLSLDTGATSTYQPFVPQQGYGSISSPDSNYSDSSHSDDEPLTASLNVPLDIGSFIDHQQQQGFRGNTIPTTNSATYFQSFVPQQQYRPLTTGPNNSVLTPSPSPQSHPQLLLQGLSLPKSAQ